MLNAVALTLLVSFSPSLSLPSELLSAQVSAGQQAPGVPDAGVAPDGVAADSAGAQDQAAQGEAAAEVPDSATGAAPAEAPAAEAPATAAPATAAPATAAPATGATASDAAAPTVAAPQAAAEPELKGMEEEPELQGMPLDQAWTGRIRYVWPFAKDHELRPGDVRIPLPVWLLAVGGGAAVAAGIPFYTLARGAESQLLTGDDSIRTDADRARVLRHGKTMEAWGVGLWATGGALVAASWASFYLFGFQEKPKGLNVAMTVGPEGGMVQLGWQLP